MKPTKIEKNPMHHKPPEQLAEQTLEALGRLTHRDNTIGDALYAAWVENEHERKESLPPDLCVRMFIQIAKNNRATMDAMVAWIRNHQLQVYDEDGDSGEETEECEYSTHETKKTEGRETKRQKTHG